MSWALVRVSPSTLFPLFSYTEGGIVGGSDVDVGDDGIFLSVGWHTKLAVAQRIERGRIKKRGRKEREKKPPVCVMWGSLSCEVIGRRRRESSPAPD